jgi:hypothetical protein
MYLVLACEQRLEPLRDKPAGQLLVHEIYRSIQGESHICRAPMRIRPAYDLLSQVFVVR